MKKVLITVALFALLGTVTVSCPTQNGNTMHDKTASPALARTVRRSAGA